MTNRHRQIEHDAAMWLARRDAGDWTDRQQAALDAWLEEDVAHRVALLRLEAAWNEAARLRTLVAGGQQRHIPARGEWARSLYFASPLGYGNASTADRDHRVRARSRPRKWRWPLLGALASLLAVVVIAGGLAWREFTHVERATWRTALGAQREVRLPDGSTSTLGSDTELRAAFSRAGRKLDLVRGEAFFDVRHDPARPFVVHANGYRVIAVGTRFDVRRTGAGELRVVVTRGLVRLQSVRDPTQALAMLPAGSVAVVDGAAVTVQRVAPEQAEDYLSWRDGFVVFHGTPLAQAIVEFNRYNKRKIMIADPSIDGLRVGGNFRLDNSTAFVRLVEELFPVRAEQHGDHIVLSRRKSASAAN